MTTQLRLARTASLAILLTASLLLLAPRAHAQPGALDPSFGDAGVVLIEEVASVVSVAFDSDGKLVAVGSAGGQATAWRFHADGTPDLSFGGDGSIDVSEDDAWYVPAFWATRPTTFTSVAPLPSGGAVVYGYTDDRVLIKGGRTNGGVGRLLEDGTLDSTFGDDGVVADAPSPAVARVTADGGIVIAGHDLLNSIPGGGSWECRAMRLLPDGTPDPSFGSGGNVLLGVDPHCEGGAVDASGRPVFAIGDTQGGSYVLRLLSDGSVDPSFDVAVEVSVPFYERGVFADPDGNITLVAPGPTLVRITAEGELDASFGQGGYADLSDLGGDVANTAVRDIAVQEDGKFLLAGQTSTESQFVARLLADGTLDAAFGEGGLVSVDEIIPGSVARTVALDAEGRVVVGGRGFIARLLNDVTVATEPSVQPEGLTLSTPAPNPTSAQTTLMYTLAEPAPVRLAVYDVLGRAVAVLAEGVRPAGQHEAALDASRLAPGLYVVRLTAGGETMTRRVTVVR